MQEQAEWDIVCISEQAHSKVHWKVFLNTYLGGILFLRRPDFGFFDPSERVVDVE